MSKYAICIVTGCGIPIIGTRVSWVMPICVGCLPPPKPLATRVAAIIEALKKKGL